ncbi:MAG: type II secretion system F family protein [Planctomycetota bacterium]
MSGLWGLCDAGLLLAQADPGAAERSDPASLLPLIYLLAFLGVFIFTFVGFLLFNEGWASYEEKYLEGAERTIDDLFLTIPPQQLLWLTLLCFAFGFVVGWLGSTDLIAGGLVGLIFSVVPRVGLSFTKAARRKRFIEQLTGALNTITNALRTGFSLPKAFQLIATDMPKPICQEFGILVQELRLGIEVEEGLDNMLERMPGQDLDLVVTSVAISNEVGGNLAEVFDRIAFTIRERRRIEGRIDSLTAQGKAQGVMVSLLPIVVAVSINYIDPELFRPMYTTIIGKAVICLIVFMEVVGYLAIRKITTIEV